MATIRTTIMTVANPDLKPIISGKNWFEIKHSNRRELLKKVTDIINENHLWSAESVNLQTRTILNRTYKCYVTMLHYCFSKSRITENELVSIVFAKENLIK